MMSGEKAAFHATSENSGKIGTEMSPGFQMLIPTGLMQIAGTVRMGLPLTLLRALERENERQLIEYTPKYDPGAAITCIMHHTLAVRIDLSNSQMVCG